MNKAPAFQFYAQDFLTGTMYLTNEEIGIYIKMLAKQWTDEKIPKKRLGFLVGYDWEKLSDELRNKFEDMGDYVVNARLEKERSRKEKFLEKQSKNGKKGGRPPKDKNPSESQKKPLEHEEEHEDTFKDLKDKKLIDEETAKIVIYEKEDFLKDWNELRLLHLKKPSFLNQINNYDFDEFKLLKANYTREDFRNALVGLFKQNKMPNDNTSMQSNPTHFLKFFNSYLSAYHDQNASLYGKKQTQE